MGKCGIITIFGEFNFGNRLQNYAVQEVLKKFGHDVETIRYRGRNDKVASTEREIDRIRLKHFREFNESIKFHDETIYKEEDVDEAFHEYFDYIVVGSDQIWNYTFERLFSEKALASFSPKHKNIAFSASFGIKTIPDKDSIHYEIFTKHLPNFKSISVREDAAKDMVEQMTGINNTKVILDPTMLIDREDWEKVMKKPEILTSEKFIVKSILGDTPECIQREIERIAKENNADIIDISNEDSPYYGIGPSEFLYLEKNSILNVTDSFHACVFSIIFNTPFVVFNREDDRIVDMFSRIETLLGVFRLENHIITDKIDLSRLTSDFEQANTILKEKQAEAYQFLEEAFED